MQLDRIDGKPDETVAWGSDVAAQMLRRLGIRYVSLNPGARPLSHHLIFCLHDPQNNGNQGGHAAQALAVGPECGDGRTSGMRIQPNVMHAVTLRA